MLRTFTLVALAASAGALKSGPARSAFSPKAAAKSGVARAVETGAGAALAAVFAATVATDSAHALSKSDYNSLTYDQIKGTGLANKCPSISGTGSINIGGKLNKFDEMCLEPQEFFVIETTTNKKGQVTTEEIPGKMMTRQTYTLYGVEGDAVSEGGKVTLKEKDGA